MLPLISNVLPTTPAVPSQNAPANAALLISTTSDASAAGRQFLPSAVMATGAPAAYFPGTAPQRQSQLQAADRTVRVAVPPPTGDFVEIQQPPVQTAAAARFSVPVTLGIPLTTQLTAQFIGQQPVSMAQQADPFLPAREEKAPSAAPKNKEPAFGTAKGAGAYSIAAARSATIETRPDIEAA